MEKKAKDTEKNTETKPEIQETKEHPYYCCCSKCVPNHWADAPNRGEKN